MNLALALGMTVHQVPEVVDDLQGVVPSLELDLGLVKKRSSPVSHTTAIDQFYVSDLIIKYLTT